MCLLKRARWFEEHLRFEDRGSAALIEESRMADHMAWQVRGAASAGLLAEQPWTTAHKRRWQRGQLMEQSQPATQVAQQVVGAGSQIVESRMGPGTRPRGWCRCGPFPGDGLERRLPHPAGGTPSRGTCPPPTAFCLSTEVPSAPSARLQEYAADYDLAEDEEIEQYYFSSAAGRARVVLGNRRYGEGGFISGGRRQVGGGQLPPS